MQEIHLLDMETPVPVLYVPAGQVSQFTPFQLSGGAIWPGRRGTVELQPPRP
jgi:hypothetical protein